MRELIHDYLQKNFRLSLSSYANHKLYDKNAKIDKRIIRIIQEIKLVFFVDTDIFIEVFDKWVDDKYQELITGIVEVQSKLEELTGKEISITSKDIYELTDSHEKFMEYVNGFHIACSDYGDEEQAPVGLGHYEGAAEPVIDDDATDQDRTIDIEERRKERLIRMISNEDGSYWDSNGELINDVIIR